MLRINLLPEAQKEKIRAHRVSLFISSLIVPIILLVIGVVGLLLFLIQYLNSINKNLDLQIKQQESQKAQYAETENMIDKVNQKIDLAKKVFAFQVDWPKILLNLASQTPGNVQITGFSFDITKDDKISLKGTASSKRSVMLFKIKLEESKYFKNVSFISSSVDGFELVCELENIKLPPGASKPATKTEEGP